MSGSRKRKVADVCRDAGGHRLHHCPPAGFLEAFFPTRSVWEFVKSLHKNTPDAKPIFARQFDTRQALSPSVELYHREAVKLIRTTGVSLTALSDHRLIDLWRQYSARQHRGGWIQARRDEVQRFVAWTGTYTAITREILAAQRVKSGCRVQIRQRWHTVRGWDGRCLHERRLQA